MLGILFALLSHLTSFATLLGLYLTVLPIATERPDWHWPLIVAAALIMVVPVTLDIWRQWQNLPKKYQTTDQIRRYMNRWIRSGGRVFSLSRDLSWVNEENKRVLLNKSKSKELVLCVEKPTELTNELSSAGAEVYFYGQLNYVPRSRFTIVDYQRDGARVAVGVSNGSEHVIREFRTGHHPLFAIAEDLANVIVRSGRTVK